VPLLAAGSACHLAPAAISWPALDERLLAATHMVRDPRLLLARERAQVEFFRQHLGRP